MWPAKNSEWYVNFKVCLVSTILLHYSNCIFIGKEIWRVCRRLVTQALPSIQPCAVPGILVWPGLQLQCFSCMSGIYVEHYSWIYKACIPLAVENHDLWLCIKNFERETMIIREHHFKAVSKPHISPGMNSYCQVKSAILLESLNDLKLVQSGCCMKNHFTDQIDSFYPLCPHKP